MKNAGLLLLGLALLGTLSWWATRSAEPVATGAVRVEWNTEGEIILQDGLSPSKIDFPLDKCAFNAGEWRWHCYPKGWRKVSVSEPPPKVAP